MGTNSTIMLRLTDEESDQVDELKKLTGRGHASRAILDVVAIFPAMKRKVERLERRIKELEESASRIQAAAQRLDGARNAFNDALELLNQQKRGEDDPYYP